MSVARQFFNEMRPYFRTLDDPFGRQNALGYPSPSAFFDDPGFLQVNLLQPHVDVTESENEYIIEADLPGVRKENAEVSIGDGGRSITIAGKILKRTKTGSGEEPAVAAVDSQTTEAPSKTVAAQPEHSVISSERAAEVSTESRSFARTVWLPRPVDGDKVTAKLEHGVLTLTVPKAHDKENVKVAIQ